MIFNEPFFFLWTRASATLLFRICDAPFEVPSLLQQKINQRRTKLNKNKRIHFLFIYPNGAGMRHRHCALASSCVKAIKAPLKE